MTKTKDTLTPEEVIAVLNRSYQTTREASSRETVDAAQKALDNAFKWLKDRRIPFYQNNKRIWVLGKNPQDEGNS